MDLYKERVLARGLSYICLNILACQALKPYISHDKIINDEVLGGLGSRRSRPRKARLRINMFGETRARRGRAIIINYHS